MGEYEPEDSRNVTLGSSNNPIEPERTGRREPQARGDAKSDEDRDRARAEQQREAGKHDPTATNDPQGIDNRAGDPRPEYDQYEVNQPGSVNKKSDHAERRAGSGQSQELNGMKQSQQRAKQSGGSITETGDAQAGYGNSKDADGRSEQDAAKKKAEGTDPVGETSPAPNERAQADAARPLGKD